MAMKLNSEKEYIENKLSETFKSKKINNTRCFFLNDGMVFRISLMGSSEPWNALVIEYAEDEAKMAINMADDGDLFYSSEYKSIDDMYNDMLKEINS